MALAIVVNAARRNRTERFRRLREPIVEGDALAEPQNGDLRSLVAALPERQRLALFLRYYADLDYRSIAEALGVKPGTVAAHLHAARDTLRGQLRD